MIYQKLLNQLIAEQVPQMQELAIQLVDFYEEIPDDDLQEDMEEILFGFGEAVESTEGAYTELLEIEKEGEDITEQLNLVLGATQRVLAAKIEMLDYLIGEGLDEYELSKKVKNFVRKESLKFKDIFVSKKTEIEFLASQNELTLEVSRELLEDAWAEVGQEKLGEVIDGIYTLIDEVIEYSQENKVTADSLNEYLDLRNKVSETAAKLKDEANPEKLQKQLMQLIKILSQLQVQQHLDLQLQIDAQLVVGNLFSEKQILGGFIDDAQDIHEQMGALLDMLEEIIMPEFLNEEEEEI
ncbi:MAG: hypothetical protein ACJAWV_003874 [Flammeovirgaceae bacterium]|jgi:hypothetical protein